MNNLIIQVLNQDADLGAHALADNTLVDFMCMNKSEFTLAECAAYHGIPVDWYQLDHIQKLETEGWIVIKETEDE